MNHPIAQLGCRGIQLANALIRWLEAWITPTLDLGLRLYLAQVFFLSGLTKIRDWDSTLSLFEYVYQVPVFPPALAAVMGTAGELGLPILLVLGLAGRFGAAGLFMVNVMAVISYGDLSELGLHDHYLWGTLLAILALHGPGRWSLDRLIMRKWVGCPQRP